MDETEHVK